MKQYMNIMCMCFAIAFSQCALAQAVKTELNLSIDAGSAFALVRAGSEKASLYIVGLAQVVKRGVQMGNTINVPAATLCDAGYYLVMIANEHSTEYGSISVRSSNVPHEVSFLASPSRLQVGQLNGITGTVYVQDAYKNLITIPIKTNFSISRFGEPGQQKSQLTRYGAAWTVMNSTGNAGAVSFTANVGDIDSVRVIVQVPGEPCLLRMTAVQSGLEVILTTDPVKDCSRNAVPDGTIITFTESSPEMKSTIDTPLKRGVAEARMIRHAGSIYTVASGTVLGNEIR